MQSTQVMFYLLNDLSASADASSAEVNTDKTASDKTPTDIQVEADANKDTESLEYHACKQAAYFYRQNKKVFIYCKNQEHAHDIDEILWAFDANSFVPHNLTGEGPSYGSAVEIGWQVPNGRRPVLINLTDTVPAFSSQFSSIIDFVPSDETLKQKARERFKQCRQLGFGVHNQAVPS
jgi:DNA polymerase-3 subunit chi